MRQFTVKSSARRQILNLTSQIQEIISESGCSNGIAVISALHSTCAISVGEVVQGVDEDLLTFLNSLVPYFDFKHTHPSDHPKDSSMDVGHGPPHPTSHVLAIMLGPSKSLGVLDQKLVLGEWQSVMLVELEGPRERTIAVQVLGETSRAQGKFTDTASHRTVKLQ